MSSKKTMSARRYAELLRKAEANLHTFDYLLKNKFTLPESIKLFKPADFLIGAFESSLSAIEAFINHLGFIFIDKWEYLENKNFWDQYKAVIKILKQLGINVSNFIKMPYADFQRDREMVRTPHHHVKSSKHDTQFIEREQPLEFSDDLKESSMMLNCWVNPSHHEAMNAYNNAVSFITYFQKEFQDKFFDSIKLTEILLSTRFVILTEDEQRQELLRRYIDDPLNPLSMVSGEDTFEPQTTN
jgi:hypothetical protein